MPSVFPPLPQRLFTLLARRLPAPVLCIILCAWLAGCGVKAPGLVEQMVSEYPFFIDDATTENLVTAIDRHLHFLSTGNQAASLRIGTHVLSRDLLIASLRHFRTIITTSADPVQLNRAIREQFYLLRASGRNEQGEMLVTGYYEPVFAGSLRQDATYRFPLYRLPDSLVKRPSGNGKPDVGRIGPDGTYLPYWTRSEIETQQVLRGQELVYLRDPLDAYLLHVQGSGRIKLPDGSLRAVHFAGSNGHDYRSLGKLLVDRGLMDLHEVTMQRIREYFTRHPESLEPMLHHNPRYIFFAWGDDHGPRGALNEIITPGRTIAIDRSILPTGAIGYLITSRPVLDASASINHWRPFGRFVLPQDSGSAIKGPGRVDLFWGAGTYAEVAAGHMKTPGKLYFLVKKDFELPD